MRYRIPSTSNPSLLYTCLSLLKHNSVIDRAVTRLDVNVYISDERSPWRCSGKDELKYK